MRKADYQTLASIIHAAMIRSAHNPLHPAQVRADNSIRREEVKRIATRLSEQLSVSAPEFLKACGMEV